MEEVVGSIPTRSTKSFQQFSEAAILDPLDHPVRAGSLHFLRCLAASGALRTSANPPQPPCTGTGSAVDGAQGLGAVPPSVTAHWIDLPGASPLNSIGSSSAFLPMTPAAARPPLWGSGRP